MSQGTEKASNRGLNAERILLISMCIVVQSTCGGQVLAQDVDATNLNSQIKKPSDEVADAVKRIDEIDRQLVLNFIKFARFNIHFHQAANHHQRWRAFTYPATRESGTSVSFGATLVDMNQRVRALRDPKTVQIDELRKVLNLALVGSSISGTASSLELAQNTWVMMNARKQGYSVGSSMSTIKELSDKTDKLLDEREDLVDKNIAQPRRKIFDIEAVLLRRIRQQLIVEFHNWSSHSRDQAWRENTFYTVDALQNFTRVGSTIIGLNGFRRPHLGGAAAISGLVANSAATVNPLLSMVLGYAVRKHQKRKLLREIPIGPKIVAPADALNELMAAEMQKSPEERQMKVLQEAIYLSDRSLKLDEHLDRETREINRYRQIAQQQSMSGPLIGLTGLVGSIMATTAFYGYRTQRDVTANLLFAGRIPQIPGQGFAITYTPYTAVKGTLRVRRLEQQGLLPAQIMQSRLDSLDALEKKLSTTQLPF
ncbi:MAG: hypothetical protein K2X93_04860 [Candidatus Obscuribacterales bacterium]|nr:hypothetical protein [Candidatus Obscuribacterales bacterium]